jgi:DNA repair exonuclease SbcCD ATPase subunit
LKRLNRDRQRVVAGLVAETRRLAGERGHPLNEAAARQVEQTLAAALADPVAGAAVASGRLVQPLEHAGLGPVDLTGAVATSGGDKPPALVASGPPAAKESPELKRVWRDLAAAEQALAKVEPKLRLAEDARRQADDRAKKAEGDANRLEQELSRARDEATRARDQVTAATSAEDKARTAVNEARDRVEALTERLKSLAPK